MNGVWEDGGVKTVHETGSVWNLENSRGAENVYLVGSAGDFGL